MSLSYYAPVQDEIPLAVLTEDAEYKALLKERDEYSQKTQELQSLLVDSALSVVAQERLLLQSLDNADDAIEDLDTLELTLQAIDTSATTTTFHDCNSRNKKKKKRLSRGGFIMSSSSCKKTTANAVVITATSPESGLSMALESLKASAEYFDQERELLLSKLDKLKDENQSQKAAAQVKLDELNTRIRTIQVERDDLMAVQTQEWNDQLAIVQSNLEASLSTNADMVLRQQDLQEQLTVKTDELLQLQNAKKAHEAQLKQQDEQIISTMHMMQNCIHDLEDEIDELKKHCEEQQVIIEELEMRNTLETKSIASHRTESTASTSSSGEEASVEQEPQETTEEDTAQQDEETQESSKKEDNGSWKLKYQELSSKYDVRDSGVLSLTRENKELKGRMEELEELTARLQTKCQAQEKSFEIIQDEESQNKAILDGHIHKIKELESQVAGLRSKCTQQEIAMKYAENDTVSVRQQQVLSKEKELKRLKQRVEELEEEQKGLTAKYSSREGQLKQLEVEMKVKEESMEHERDQHKGEVESLVNQITRLEKEQQEQRKQPQVEAEALRQAEVDKQQAMEDLKSQVACLQAEKNNLVSKYQSLQQQQTVGAGGPTLIEEEEQEENDGPIDILSSPPSMDEAEERMKEFMDEIDYIRSKLAAKSVSRETTIALLQEENELKDARIEMLENMMASLMQPSVVRTSWWQRLRRSGGGGGATEQEQQAPPAVDPSNHNNETTTSTNGSLSTPAIVYPVKEQSSPVCGEEPLVATAKFSQ